MIEANDGLILGVVQVIRLCEVRRQELAAKAEQATARNSVEAHGNDRQNAPHLTWCRPIRRRKTSPRSLPKRKS